MTRATTRWATVRRRARSAVLFATGAAPGLLLAFALLVAGPWARAANGELHWASDSDALSMDPYTRNELVQLGLTGNIYEPLARHAPDGTLAPVLATAWEQTGPLEWTFHLRPNVRWQDGSPFSADDVLFSLERVQSPTSLLRSVMAAVVSATRVDDLTVVLRTAAPDPILPHEAAIWFIMSKAWSIAHEAERPALLARAQENYATRHALGTGPYRLVSREPNQRSVFEANPDWWGERGDAPARAVFEVIANDSTRVAALLAGDVDLITALPPLDVARVRAATGLRAVDVPELRVIFLGMDQSRERLLKSDVPDRNPFRDPRVREAVMLAIDEEAIVQRLLRGFARPSGLLWGQGVRGYDPALDRRPSPDPARGRSLMAEAGFADGFGVTLDCPSNRYMMDEEICTALAPMLARIGIRLSLNIQPKARFFAEVGPPDYRTSLYLLGWSPTSYDAHNVVINLLATRGPTQGAINFGGFSDATIDRLAEQIGHATDAVARDGLLADAARRAQALFAYIPLHQQHQLFGVRNGVSLTPSPDGIFRLRLVGLH